MKYRLLILPRASADIDEQFAYIALASLDAAIRFHVAVQATLEQIRKNPYLGAVCEFDRLPGMRQKLVRGFDSHIVFYNIVMGRINVVRLLHGARDIEAVLEE